MNVVTVGPKYQIVIPKSVRKEQSIRPGDKAIVSRKRDNRLEIQLVGSSIIAKLNGLGKHVWRGIDADKYVESLRREWRE